MESQICNFLEEDADEHVGDEAGLREAADQEVRGGGEEQDEGDLDEEEREGEAQRLVAQEHALQVDEVVVVARRRQGEPPS